MTNKKQLITALTLATILIAGGFSMAPQAFSTGIGGNGGNSEHEKDKKGGEDSNKFKDWKKENDHHDDNNDDEHDKVKICHIPPGNEENAHTIEISESALASHLEHGDSLGACLDDDEEENTSYIIFIRAITHDNHDGYILEDHLNEFTISINGEPQVLPGPLDIIPNTENTITGTVPDGFTSVLISGDPACPVNIYSDTFNLKKGQSIVCTIYYDDDFVPGGVVGPPPTVTLIVKEIDTSLGVNPTFAVDGVPVDLGTMPIELTADKTTTITQTNDGVIDDLDEEKEVLPTRITGDGHCPEALEGTITLSAGQEITCTLEYGKEIEPGVVFWHNNLQWTPFPVDDNGDPTIHSTLGDDEDCSVVSPDFPCAKEVGGVFKIADPMLPSTGKTLILFNLLGAEALGCEVDGIGDSGRETTDGKTVYEFTVNCSNFVGNPVWNWNYAFIETE